MTVSDDDEETIGQMMKRRAAATKQTAEGSQVPRFQRMKPGETLEGNSLGQQSHVEWGSASKPRQFHAQRHQGNV